MSSNVSQAPLASACLFFQSLYPVLELKTNGSATLEGLWLSVFLSGSSNKTRLVPCPARHSHFTPVCSGLDWETSYLHHIRAGSLHYEWSQELHQLFLCLLRASGSNVSSSALSQEKIKKIGGQVRQKNSALETCVCMWIKLPFQNVSIMH